MKCVIAEFDKLPLYFPIYLGIRKLIFKNYGLKSIKFIQTHNDIFSYLTLVSNRATVGLADPIYSISEDKTPKGEIIGTLVNKIPFIVVALPGKSIENIQDLKKYKIATYSKLTTCHTIARYILGEKTQLIEISHTKIVQALINGEVDFALILPEQLISPLVQVFSLKDLYPSFLFTGLIQIHFPKSSKQSIALKLALSESLRYLHSNKEESFKYFCGEFPDLQNPQEVFEKYLNCWSKNGILKQEEWYSAFKVWSSIYKNLFQDQNPSFLFPKPEEEILRILTSKKYSRDYPNNLSHMLCVVKKSISQKERINLIGFWGASDKINFGYEEERLIEYLGNLKKELSSYYEDISFTFLLSDTHAILNGYDAKKVKQYLVRVKKELDKNKIQHFSLSKLWRECGITQGKIIKAVNKNNSLKTNIYKNLIKKSENHFHSEDKILGAKIYYTMRKIEAPFIKEKFPDSILFSYTDAAISEILPSMPTLFFYTIKRDKNNLPWFQK